MKKNVIKLLAIAFAVALFSTFLFYRLLVGKLASGERGRTIAAAAHRIEPGATITAADVKMAAVPDASNLKGAYFSREEVIGLMALEAIEPGAAITEARVAARDSKAAAGARIPSGMRAVSIHVSDSSGVVSLLRTGHRIDIHAVGGQSSVTNLRTVLQNVEVLAAGPGEATPGRGSYQVVTVLVSSEQAELLALADSGARVRISLRNAGDDTQQSTRRLALNQLFDGTAAARAAVQPASAPSPAAGEAGVTLLVRMLSASPPALDELRTELTAPPDRQSWQVSALRPGSDVEGRLNRLSAARQLEVLSSSRLAARTNRLVSVQAGAGRLRIQLAPSAIRRGSLRLRLEPELRSSVAGGVASRRLEAEIDLADRQSCLLTGLHDSTGNAALLERLFPGRTPAGAKREFLVLVTPQLANPVETAGLGRAR